uniref:Uncharacterized protein n=1 Tax=Salix viminalis TaxID=40686 RepID=A0A6N2MFK5_SALVM
MKGLKHNSLYKETYIISKRCLCLAEREFSSLTGFSLRPSSTLQIETPSSLCKKKKANPQELWRLRL